MPVNDRRAMAARIVNRINALAAISADGDAAITRVYLSRELKIAADLLIGWMQEAGMTAHMDAVGNVVGRYEGEKPGLPCLLLGSHYDTVINAGRWDGPLGVITAIECVAALHAQGRRLPFAVEVVGFADEEGVRFSSTLIGSRAIAGTFDLRVLSAKGSDGVSMQEAMVAFGLDPQAISSAAKRRSDVLAYMELHIEQGPVLEAENLPIGVVTAINGATRLLVTLTGMAGHAGTVPMNLRRDALAGAAECISLLEKLCRERAGMVGTVGHIHAEPGATNVIPGKVSFTVDMRSASDDDRKSAVADVVRAMEKIATARSLDIGVTVTHDNRTAPCAPWLRQQAAEAVRISGYPVRELPSGAGHDGMAIVDIADIGMLFVRCKGGISHHPAEHVADEDAGIGAEVLLRFISDFRPPAG